MNRIQELQKEIERLNIIFNECNECEGDEGANRLNCKIHQDEYIQYNWYCAELKGWLDCRAEIIKIIEERVDHHNPYREFLDTTQSKTIRKELNYLKERIEDEKD